MKPELKLESLLRSIVSNIGRETKNPVIIYEDVPDPKFYLQVDARDQGHMVGKGGTVIGAIQAILWIAGMAQIGKPCLLKLEEPIEIGSRACAPFVPRSDWDRKRLNSFAHKILDVCFKENHSGCIIEDLNEVSGIARIRLDKYLKAGLDSTAYLSALKVLIHSAGMSMGAKVSVEIEWA